MLVVLSTAVGCVPFVALLAEVVLPTVIDYVNSAVAAVAGVAVLDESLIVPMIVGFRPVLTGSVLSTRRRAAPEADTASPCAAAGRARRASALGAHLETPVPLNGTDCGESTPSSVKLNAADAGAEGGRPENQNDLARDALARAGRNMKHDLD